MPIQCLNKPQGNYVRNGWAAAEPGRASSRRPPARRQRHSAAGVEGTGGMEGLAAAPVGGGGAGFETTYQATHQQHKRRRCGGRRRDRRARAGFEIDHSEPLGSRVAISRAAGPDGARNTSGATSNTINDSGRRPRAHQAARPNKPPGGAWNTSGTISNNTRRRQLAGGRARRRPQHQRRNTPHRHNKTARPHRGRAAQSVSEAHRRTTMMSGSPRPLSWRTLEMPSLAATSFAVPSMRGSS